MQVYESQVRVVMLRRRDGIVRIVRDRNDAITRIILASCESSSTIKIFSTLIPPSPGKY